MVLLLRLLSLLLLVLLLLLLFSPVPLVVFVLPIARAPGDMLLVLVVVLCGLADAALPVQEV